MLNAKMMMGAAAVLLLPLSAQAQQDPQLIGEGARVYSSTCVRCHNARSSTERTDAQWVAIVAHMRARGNLTKGQAAAVLAFLQATNLPEGGATMAALPLGADASQTVISPPLLALLAATRTSPPEGPDDPKR